MSSTKRTLVIGLGNPILTDDGAGIYAARAVADVLPPDADVDVIEVSCGGLTLMEAMIGYERVIVIDAFFDFRQPLGSVRVFDAGHLASTLNTASTHDADLQTALRVGRLMNASLPEDEAIQIVGITARDVLTFGETPNPEIVAAIPAATQVVFELLAAQEVRS